MKDPALPQTTHTALASPVCSRHRRSSTPRKAHPRLEPKSTRERRAGLEAGSVAATAAVMVAISEAATAEAEMAAAATAAVTAGR